MKSNIVGCDVEQPAHVDMTASRSLQFRLSIWSDPARCRLNHLTSHAISDMAKSKLSPQEVNLLHEILEMFKAFDAARHRITGESINWNFLTFEGFDANDSSESKFSLHGGYHDSHRKMLPHYVRLLAAWRGCPDNKNLTRSDVLRIIQTARPTR